MGVCVSYTIGRKCIQNLYSDIVKWNICNLFSTLSIALEIVFYLIHLECIVHYNLDFIAII